MDISICTPINKLGYGVVGTNIVKYLSQLPDVRVSLFPIGHIEVEKHSIPHIKECLENAKTFDYYAPCIRIYHQHSLEQFVGRGIKIGLPIFEMDRFTAHEQHNLAFPDVIIACSKWAQGILNTHIPKQTIYEVPLGVDTDIFKPQPLASSDTMFFNIGKWEVRKGHDVLIEAFKQEFKSNEKVQLLLCCTNPFLNREQTNQWVAKTYGCRNIKLIPRLESQADVADLINACDCGVFPSRAEGWNLEALETLACGRHLIITDYSAHTEYADYINSSLIPIKETEPAYDNIWGVFHGQGNWAKIGSTEFDLLKQHMRNIHELKQSGRLSLNQDGINTANQFHWTNTALQIKERLL